MAVNRFALSDLNSNWLYYYNLWPTNETKIKYLEELTSRLRKNMDVDAAEQKKIATEYYTVMKNTKLSHEECMKAMTNICWLDTSNDQYRLFLAKIYYGLKLYLQAYQECENLNDQHNADGLLLKANCLCKLAESDDQPEAKLYHYAGAMRIFKELSVLIDEAQFIRLKNNTIHHIKDNYKRILDLYENRMYPTYKDALDHVVLMKRMQAILPNELTNFTDIALYPKLMPVFILKNIVNEILTRYDDTKCCSQFFRSKINKRNHIISSFHAAENEFNFDNIDLIKFLNCKQGKMPSLLESLQEGRWGVSGHQVGSFKSFVKLLNKYIEGMGDAVSHLHPVQPENSRVNIKKI